MDAFEHKQEKCVKLDITDFLTFYLVTFSDRGWGVASSNYWPKYKNGVV